MTPEERAEKIYASMTEAPLILDVDFDVWVKQKIAGAIRESEAQLREENQRLAAVIDRALEAGHCYPAAGAATDRGQCLVDHVASGRRDRIALREENQLLRAALRPFALQARIIAANEEADGLSLVGCTHFHFLGSYSALTLDDCRKALAALNHSAPAPPAGPAPSPG